MRKTDMTGTRVCIPDNPKEKLPLIMTEFTHPSKERFDEQVSSMEETTLQVFEDYVKAFTGRVEIDISRPMTEREMRRQLQKKGIT